MNKPITQADIDFAEIEAALEAEKAERNAAGGARWKLKLFLVFGLVKIMVGIVLLAPHA